MFKLWRGVKQGGVLSGSLFNFFINDLIELCCNANIGASFMDLIVCILVFCDDICLLSWSLSGISLNDAQSLFSELSSNVLIFIKISKSSKSQTIKKKQDGPIENFGRKMNQEKGKY